MKSLMPALLVVTVALLGCEPKPAPQTATTDSVVTQPIEDSTTTSSPDASAKDDPIGDVGDFDVNGSNSASARR